MRKIAKSTKDKFKNAIVKMMADLGATSTTNGIDNRFRAGEWELESQGGKIVFTLPSDHTYCFTLFGRFMDVDKTNEVMGKHFGHNEFSGKWNFHLTNTPSDNTGDLVKFINAEILDILP